MPKARKRKRGPAQKSGRSGNVQQVAVQQTMQQAATTRGPRANRPFLSPRVAGPQSLIWPVMVSLGCWGMAFSFFVFSTDPNHVLFAGMAALLALLWTFSVFVRVRKLLVIRKM